MNPIGSILAATDFSPSARDALARAAGLAAEHGAALTLLHVISGPSLDAFKELLAGSNDEPAGEAARLLEEAAAELAAVAGRQAATRVRVGGVHDELAAAAERADLLVIGDRGLHPMRDMIIGTTAERLLGSCRKPVLVVKRGAAAPYRKVLVPVDFSACSHAAFKAALGLAPRADLHVCHAFGLPSAGKFWLADVPEAALRRYEAVAGRAAEERLAVLAAEADSRDRERCRLLAVAGDPSMVVIAEAEKREADLIVIGRHGESALRDFLLGSVTRHVLANAPCDVLVVPVAS
ncbi:MAG: universal stress protein [Sterolibacteriaceae bacterium MAG5]|nr:universal stress protein [Candidatus Nitricoxidireducens bremensis]